LVKAVDDTEHLMPKDFIACALCSAHQRNSSIFVVVSNGGECLSCVAIQNLALKVKTASYWKNIAKKFQPAGIGRADNWTLSQSYLCNNLGST
jgi:hypothetical protein